MSEAMINFDMCHNFLNFSDFGQNSVDNMHELMRSLPPTDHTKNRFYSLNVNSASWVIKWTLHFSESTGWAFGG